MEQRGRQANESRPPPDGDDESGAPKARARHGRGSADHLLAFQRLAWSSITISATRRCPLSCSHCITRSGPDLPDPILSPETAARWACELPGLARQGLRHISFTGGEPLLAVDAIEILSVAAAASGIRSYVVTSGAWASSRKAADRILERLQRIDHWDLGYDAYHAEGIPWSRLVTAVETLRDHARPFTLRVCLSRDRMETEKLIADLETLVGSDGEIILQPVRALGRAESAVAGEASPHLPRRPCVSTGLFLRADGSTGPCCSGLAYEARDAHPFDYGAVEADGDLMRAWRAWRADPLLRLLRLVGFAGIEGWLGEAGLLDKSATFSSDPCEACVGLWRRDPGMRKFLRDTAQSPAVQAKLDAMETALYGHVWSETG